MQSLLVPLIAVVQEAAVDAEHISKWWFGAFAMVVFLLLLAVTVIMGQGRPHS
jgi:hypothetical protein